MIPVHVPLIETRADKKRAREIRSAEENFVRRPTPSFYTDGRGICRTLGDPDDFADDSRKPAGFRARARAAAICAECPFSGECLTWAIGSEQTGVFGGEWLRKGKVQ